MVQEEVKKWSTVVGLHVYIRLDREQCCSSPDGNRDTETASSPKFPSFPCGDMLRSPQTPAVSYSPRLSGDRTAAFHSRQSVGFLPGFDGDYPVARHYTHCGAHYRSLSSRYPRLRTASYDTARGFATELLARRCSGGTRVRELAPTGKH